VSLPRKKKEFPPADLCRRKGKRGRSEKTTKGGEGGKEGEDQTKASDAGERKKEISAFGIGAKERRKLPEGRRGATCCRPKEKKKRGEKRARAFYAHVLRGKESHSLPPTFPRERKKGGGGALPWLDWEGENAGGGAKTPLFPMRKKEERFPGRSGCTGGGGKSTKEEDKGVRKSHVGSFAV